jgi:hypothetical protein
MKNGRKTGDFDVKRDIPEEKNFWEGERGLGHIKTKECKVYVYLYIDTYTLHPC